MTTTSDDLRLRIAPATRKDVPLLLALIRELAEFERLTHVVRVTEAVLEESLFGDRPAAEAVLGYCNDEPVAYAVFFTNFSTFLGRPGLYLEDLYVRPSARRSGIGKAMLRYVAQVCVERGYGRIEWVVLDWNEPAIRFYQSLGAAPVPEWRVFSLGGDALTDLTKAE